MGMNYEMKVSLLCGEAELAGAYIAHFAILEKVDAWERSCARSCSLKS